MMMRLIIVALGTGLIGSAMAGEESKVEQLGQPAPIMEQPIVASAVAPASAPVAPTPAAAAPAPAPASPAAAAPAPAVPHSAVRPELRKGADATKCLESGSDKEIAACAEKFR